MATCSRVAFGHYRRHALLNTHGGRAPAMKLEVAAGASAHGGAKVEGSLLAGLRGRIAGAEGVGPLRGVQLGR